jgi:CheY-like chemotaxis protein
MTSESDFRKHVKDALEHLYDTAYLAFHPLLPQLVVMASAGRITRAQKLRSMLKEAIEAIRPQQNLPATAPGWRGSLAVRYRYIQGMSQAQIENELGISLRQLQRELHKGLDAVAARLWEMRAATPADPALPEASEVDALINEMAQWQIARETCDVRMLLDDARGMLGPFLNQKQLLVTSPATLLPVLVDTTLARQALFKVLRLALQTGIAETITISVRAAGSEVEIIIEGGPAGVDSESPDWQSAQLLFERQGGTLAAGEAGANIRLPQARPPQVLIVDDNQAIHQLFERYLSPHFYEVVHALSGPEALQRAAAAPPHVIILDVMLPSVDGWQVLRTLMDNPATAGVPVIVCSALKEPELALSMGARAFLKKPVDRLELLATLASLHGQGPVVPAGAASPSEPPGS